MTRRVIDMADIRRSSYEAAWREFCSLPGLTPDEKVNGPNMLHWYIQVMIEVGERDPSKIAKAAIGMMREYEQILRSKARLTCAAAIPFPYNEKLCPETGAGRSGSVSVRRSQAAAHRNASEILKILRHFENRNFMAQI